MNQLVYNNWRLEQDEYDIAWLIFDCQEGKVNKFDEASLNELDDILQTITQQSTYQGLIITAQGQKGFAGADLDNASHIQNEQQARDYIQKAHQVFNRLAALSIPTVTMINGFCLGGGFEMALACDYRVALQDRQVKIGLPEVKLGLIPGWGGSVRLPRLIGPTQAFSLILAGRIVDAKQASRMGMVDAVVPQRHLQSAATDYVLNEPKLHKPKWWASIMNLRVLRPVIAYNMRRGLQKNNVQKHHYPAPYYLISNWRHYGVSQAALKGEINKVAQLLTEQPTQNLIHVFFLQQRLKQLNQSHDFKPHHVHVIGAGTMGADIAAWCVFSGMTVTLQDKQPKKIAEGIKRAQQLFSKKFKDRYLIQNASDRLIPDCDGQGCSQADVLIEAIFEDLAAKQSVFKYVEQVAQPHAILATNTSSIPLADITEALNEPQRLVGIHFFNPVSKMQLVEVVQDAKTDEHHVDQAIQFVKKLNRLPLPVRSTPGFVVNRVLMPYLLEAFNLYQDNLPIPVIDQAALNFGMPMGPMQLADQVGLDVCLSVAEHVAEYFQYDVPQVLKDKVQAGHLGVKSKKGFYNYTKTGKLIKGGASHYSQDTHISPVEIQNRLTYRYINEAMACWREGIVSDSDLLDAGMVFGTGFAPFRGGPLHFAKQMGVDTVVSRLEQLSEHYGSRFEPDPGWGEWRSKDELEVNADLVTEVEEDSQQ